jgi:ABC-type glutathione transport system ATPase component/ABC-type dipeptide/oligopeptide/nickel transport system permease subunit
MRELVRALLGNRKALVGAAVLVVFAVIAIVGPFVLPDASAPVGRPLAPPSLQHWLGTTGQGQDVLALTVTGTRNTLAIAFAVGALVVLLGALVGVTAGYFGGHVDRVLSLGTNVFLVIPGLPLAIIVAAYLRPGTGSVIAVLALSGWAWHARVFRAQALTLRARDYIAAARIAGESHARVIVGELLPNMAALLAAAFIGATIYALGALVGLEFLGLGDPGAVSWGANLYWAANDAALLTGSWWVFVPTGVCIALVGFALTLLNVALDEFTNPRLRPRAASEPTAAPSTTMPVHGGGLIAVRDLRVTFGGTRAVDGVSFDLLPGEILGLAGESGSGKSTIGYALLRLLDESACRCSGQIRFAGEDVLGKDARRLRAYRWADVAMVFQGALDALNPVLTAGDQITDVLRARAGLDAAAADARARELIGFVGLEPHHLRAYPHQLSGGMRQRVVIAIALALSPKVLILDEPTTSLDVIVQRDILAHIQRLRRELGLTILFISHDLPLLLSIADRVGVMQHGRLLEVDTPAVLRAHASDPYTRRLLSAFPSLEPPSRPPVSTDFRPALLEVSHLSRRYGSTLALDDVSFDVRAGEVLAVVGASGGGKSTLARLLSGLDRPDRGTVYVAGDDAHRVQMVFQDPFASLNPARRVRHHLARPLRLHGGPQDLDPRIESLLASVGLPPAIARRFPHELSGGQRQRVALARALAAGPRLLIADEPTSMLDASLRAELLALLRELADERGLGVVLVTHDLPSAASIADRVLVLRRGRVVEAGPIGPTLRAPSHAYTGELLDAARHYPPSLELHEAVS